MHESRRGILDAISGGPVTGPDLADRLGVSRAAVWKHVEALRADGFDIPSTDEGYRLDALPEYGAAAIEYGLSAPYTIEYRDSVTSTNAVAREHAGTGTTDLVVVADEQTGGRGRLEREWSSPAGGVWMSILLTPDIPPANVPLLTLAAAVAVTEAVRDRGVDAAIKWPNDVIVPGEGDDPDRKLCGILTEMEGESSRVSWVIIGIGVNANIAGDDLPANATSVSAEVGAIDRRAFVQDVLETFATLADDPDTILDRWSALAATLGQRVRITEARDSFVGEAVDVTETGALVVAVDGDRRTVHAGDCEHLRPV